jgi:hypothetical protein
MADMLDKSFLLAAMDAAHSSPKYAGTVLQITHENLNPPPPSDIPSTQSTPAEVVAEQAPDTEGGITPPPATETKREDTVAEDKIQISNHWGVQIGAFRTRSQAERMLQHVKGNYHELHDGEPLVATVKVRGGRMYQARFTGLTQPNAAGACNALQARGHTCVTLKPVS